MNPDAPPEPPVNILLVDDRAEGLMALEAVLASPGHQLVKARSGDEALAQLLDHEFAVILLDIQMPKMDGFQTAALIKQRPQWREIPILFVTAINQDTPYVHEGYRMGAVDYIFKPFDPFILRSKVEVFAELYRRNTKLRQAQEEIRRKDEELYQTRKLEAIGRLAGGVAHDFNNILTGILGISRELQETFDATDHRRADLDEVIKAARRAFSLTRQLLAYARRQIISPQVLDLNAVVSDMREMLGRLIGEDIHLKTVLDPHLGSIHVDQGYLEQILVNLILNARDAMPRGGTVTIETKNVDLSETDIQKRSLRLNAGPHVVLSIQDTGTGMSEDVKAHIFEPFFTTKGRNQGTGLGLSTVYGIVKQSKGDITVQSRLKEGTTIDIYLPQLAHAAAQREIPAESTPLRGDETVLVVEDEDLVRRVVRNILCNQGYAVIEARSGKEALSLCERFTGAIDLLVTDVVMPEMDGRELAEKVTTNYPNVKVLYMSGYTDDIIAQRGMLEPGIEFIEKSAISSDLAQKVSHLLRTRGRQNDATSQLTSSA